jgi:glycerol kinase
MHPGADPTPESRALDRRYRAAMDSDQRERLFRRWRKAVELSKGWALDDE